MANMNRVHQRQVKASRDEFAEFEAQMLHVESRTRQKATLKYDVKTQWDQGTKIQIDSDTVLDKIQLSQSATDVYYTTGTFTSYVIDVGATDVKFDSIMYAHTKPAGTSIAYSTRSGSVDVPDSSWTDWAIVNSENMISSANGRYIQFKIVLSTTDTAVTPVVDLVGVTVWGSTGLQELFDARGPYKTLSERFDMQSSVYQLKIVPGEGDTQIIIPRIISDGSVFKVYVNGLLATEGVTTYDVYTLEVAAPNTLVKFSYPLSNQDLIVCRIEGAGSGIVTIKENVIVDEVPVTTDNISFTLDNEMVIGKEEVYVAGIKMVSGSQNDYTASGKVITFNYTINTSLTVTVTYYHN